MRTRGNRVVRIVTLALAFALGGGSVHAYTAWTRTSPYVARVLCKTAPGYVMGEDAAAHLRLLTYAHNADGTLVLRYACRHTGY